MDMEFAMRQALGDTVTYEHTDVRSGVRALQLTAEAEPVKKHYKVRKIEERHSVDRNLASEYRPLFRAVAQAHGLDPEYMLKVTRDVDAVMGRAHFAWELKRRTGMSLTWCGKQMGGVQHTTIRYYVRKFEKRMADYAAHLDQVMEACP